MIVYAYLSQFSSKYDSKVIIFDNRDWSLLSKMNKFALLSGCGTVGRVVASKNRGPGFGCSLQQIF